MGSEMCIRDRPGVYLGTIQNGYTTKPPKKEQSQISDYIASIEDKYRDIFELEKRQIELLQEYKSSLINSAVTGKIKVPV